MKTLTVIMLLLLSGLPSFAGHQVHPKIQSSSEYGDHVITHMAFEGDWKTAITLFNQDKHQVTFTLKFYNNNGVAQKVTLKNIGNVSDVSGNIPVNGSTVVETVGFTNSGTLTGWANLETSDSISGFAIFTNRKGQEATVPLESYIAQQQILAFDNASGNVMGIALVNGDTYHVSHVTMIFYDRNGLEIGRDDFFLGTDAHVSYAMPDEWKFTAGQVGTVFIATDDIFSAVSVLGLRFNPSGAFTSVMAVQIPSELERSLPTPPVQVSQSGATALCVDGTLSYSKTASGTCSHHGGVMTWINHP
jgi:hypothetical protein